MNSDVFMTQRAATQNKRKLHRAPVCQRNINPPLATCQHHGRSDHDPCFWGAAGICYGTSCVHRKFAGSDWRSGHIRATKPDPFFIAFHECLDIIGMKRGCLGTRIHLYCEIKQAKIGQADRLVPADHHDGHRRTGWIILHVVVFRFAFSQERNHSGRKLLQLIWSAVAANQCNSDTSLRLSAAPFPSDTLSAMALPS